MKQSDIATLILVVSISLAVSYLVGNAVINSEQNRSVDVEIARPISAEMPQPDPEIYTSDYVNPTELIQIGGANNDQPFGQAQQNN